MRRRAVATLDKLPRGLLCAPIGEMRFVVAVHALATVIYWTNMLQWRCRSLPRTLVCG